MLKRNLAVFAAIGAATALVLSGCSSSGSSDNAGAKDSNGAGTLTVASNSSTKPALDKLIADFEKANPKIKIKVTYADTDPYQTAMTTQLNAGTAPDVMEIPPGKGGPLSVLNIGKRGYLKDMSGASWASTVPKGVDAVTVLDGKRYNVAVTITGIGAIYNKKAVQKAGLDIPDTWSGVMKFCADAKKKGTPAFALGLQTQWVTQLIPYTLATTLVDSKDPDFSKKMDSGKATFVKSGWLESFQKVMDMKNAGCFQKDALGTSVDAANKMVANGKALAIVTVTNQLATLKQIAPDGVEFGMFALPATDNPDETWMSGSAGDAYGINSKAENPVGAQKFIDFLVAHDGDYATAGGALPVFESSDYTIDPTLAILGKLKEAGKTFSFQNQLWPNAKVQAALFDGVQKMYGGQESAKQALTAMDQAYAEGSS